MFTIIENILNSLESIKSNKLRSALSMLGIIIWVSSVVILTAIWNGSQQTIVAKVQEMGTNILTISAGWGFGNVNAKSSSKDILNIKVLNNIKEIDGLSGVLPIVSGNGQIVYSSNNMSASIYGVSPDYFKVKDVDIAYGSNITQKNIDNLDKVAVIWQDILDELFDGKDPIGKKIKMDNNVFEVIWVIEENSTLSSYVFIPISTASIRIFWQKYYSQILIYVTDSTQVDAKEEEINNSLIKLLNITDTENLPYRIRNQSEMLSNLSSITGTLTMLLGGIAWISLLVGWIWVMNIMLVSVTERTKEIGIRKAIWAGKNDILLQFLTEASSLSIIGGIIGIWFSYAVVYLLTHFWIPAVITTNSLITSFCFSFGIGIVFWLLPAYKAAKLRPIEALRFE